jgi:soluble lytic murein transglycosylase
VNLEYGQSYLEKLRDMPATGGLLPKVIAAYNAGPTPVTRWNSEIRDNGDPLLFIESIPYWETRGYVAIILRNYWIYEMRENKASGSMHGLAQYLWPKFPDENGNVVARRASGGSVAAR